MVLFQFGRPASLGNILVEGLKMSHFFMYKFECMIELNVEILSKSTQLNSMYTRMIKIQNSKGK